jgi:hypothetical protein
MVRIGVPLTNAGIFIRVVDVAEFTIHATASISFEPLKVPNSRTFSPRTRPSVVREPVFPEVAASGAVLAADDGERSLRRVAVCRARSPMGKPSFSLPLRTPYRLVTIL